VSASAEPLFDTSAANVAHGTARSEAVAAAVRRAVPDSAGLTLLDYGCGPGHIGLRLADDFGRIILADVDPVVLAQAADAAGGLSQVETRLMDLTVQAPADLRADVVVSCMSWHHLPDLAPLLEALPLVAPGGRLLVADMDADGGAYHRDNPEFAWITGFDRAELAHTVVGHGYRDVVITDLWQGQKWINGQLTPISLFWLQALIPVAPVVSTGSTT